MFARFVASAALTVALFFGLPNAGGGAGAMDTEGGDDLRTRRGYSQVWINEDEDVSILYFLFDNGVLNLYQDEPGMGHVFSLDLSGLPDPSQAAESITWEDADGDGYGDLEIPLPEGKSARWLWNASDWTFDATETSRRLPAPAKTRKTLEALLSMTAPRIIVHFGELSDLASRLGHSWLLDYALDAFPGRKPVLDWLQSFPLESFSLVIGFSEEDEDTFHGAIRFTDDKLETLKRLEQTPPPSEDGKDESDQEIGMAFASLLGVPEAFLDGDGIFVLASFVGEKRNLFQVQIISTLSRSDETLAEVFASIAGADEKLLVFGSTPEEAEQAKKTIEDENVRLAIRRHDEGKANFFLFVDDAERTGTTALAEELDFVPQKAAEIEIALGLFGNGFDVSLHHNVFDLLLGDVELPPGAWSAEDGGFELGGGEPWIAGSLSLALTEQNVLDILAAAVDGDERQVREILSMAGDDPAVLSGLLRSVGLVFGGQASVKGKWMPGGYVFASGDAEKMRALVPLIEMHMANSPLSSFQAVDREGWDVFFVLADDEVREYAAGLPFCIGMRDGVFMAGVLNEEDLDIASEMDWQEGDGEVAILRGYLKPLLFASKYQDFFSEVSFSEMHRITDGMGIEDLFEPGVWAIAFKCFAAFQEIKLVRLDMTDWNRLDLTIRTGEVEYKDVWEWLRTSRQAARED